MQSQSKECEKFDDPLGSSSHTFVSKVGLGWVPRRFQSEEVRLEPSLGECVGDMLSYFMNSKASFGPLFGLLILGHYKSEEGKLTNSLSQNPEFCIVNRKGPCLKTFGCDRSSGTSLCDDLFRPRRMKRPSWIMRPWKIVACSRRKPW